MKKNYVIRGFTLIEIMVVVCIIAVLAAIAVPTYRSYQVKSRRIDAQTGLLQIQSIMEDYFAKNNLYPHPAITIPVLPCFRRICSKIPLPPRIIPSQITLPTSLYYQYTFTSTNTTYTITATAIGNQVNDQENGTNCNVLSIDNVGNKLPAACWPTQ